MYLQIQRNANVSEFNAILKMILAHVYELSTIVICHEYHYIDRHIVIQTYHRYQSKAGLKGKGKL